MLVNITYDGSEITVEATDINLEREIVRVDTTPDHPNFPFQEYEPTGVITFGVKGKQVQKAKERE